MKKLLKNKIVLALIALLVIAALIGVAMYITNSSDTVSEALSSIGISLSDYDDDDPSYDADTATYLTLNGDSIEVESEYVSVDGNTATITDEGVYVLSGTLSGTIYVNAQDDDLVRIILSGATINSPDGPAIYVLNADKTVITIEEGTDNVLTDTTTYTDEEATAVIYSKDDLVFNGYGTMTVTGNYQDGVLSKDDLKVVSGTINITAMNNGLKGKDSVKIKAGDITIDAQNDAIKSTNTETTEKGYIEIQSGTLNLTAEHDGMQASNYILIESGNINITSGGGSSNSSKVGQSSQIFMGGMWSSSQTEEDSDSYKGIKAENSITINGGTFDLNCADDAIHCNGDIDITAGTYEIASGDDGIHADSTLTIDSSDINISTSYEGIEAEVININGGDISVVASDDGINSAGGTDSSQSSGRPGDNFSNSSSATININGGTIYINASGDGIDSNGSIYMDGGTLYIDGPTNSGNGAIDYENSFVMSDGVIVAVGAAGMAETISSSSSVYCMNATVSSQSANTKISITSSSGSEIISYTPTKSYSSIVIATPDFTKGSTYTLNLDGSSYTSFTISSIITNVGSSTNNTMNNNNRMR